MFIDFSPEKKSHIKTEIMKSLKIRNKSPVHYKYTRQGCANQNHLLAAGCSGREAFTMWGQRLFFSRTRVTPRGSSAGCDAWTHTHRRVTAQPHCRAPGDALPASPQRAGVYQVENSPANGSLPAGPWLRWEPRGDLHTTIGLQDWAVSHPAVPFMDFFFF